MADDKTTDSPTGHDKTAAQTADQIDDTPVEAADPQDPQEQADLERSTLSPEAANDGGGAEVADLKSKLLHVLADMENLRRRTEREIADAHKYGVTSFAREMLTVGDNLRRAIDAVPDALRDGGDQSVSALIEGVEVTERTLGQTMTKFGVARIEAKGKKFDPSLHQAMMEVDDEEAEPGSVADEIQVGYVIGERVLRPAFVSVVKKRQQAETPSATDGDGAAEAPAEGAEEA